ncbi:MAG: histidine kinase [Comamonadaceae bacterium]|nr:histidine kinase [Comamonadaceae bacterium]
MARLERRLGAELAANALNASQLHRLSARLVRAQEDERRLISRELHDEVGQALTAVKMQLALARRSVPDAQAGAIDEARAVADAALQSRVSCRGCSIRRCSTTRASPRRSTGT